jgi:hypothetical protein
MRAANSLIICSNLRSNSASGDMVELTSALPGLATGLPHCTGEGSLPCALRLSLSPLLATELTALSKVSLALLHLTYILRDGMRPAVIRLSNVCLRIVLEIARGQVSLPSISFRMRTL